MKADTTTVAGSTEHAGESVSVQFQADTEPTPSATGVGLHSASQRREIRRAGPGGGRHGRGRLGSRLR